MTTGAENERLAVLENQYRVLQTDVSEIKADVKALVVTQTQLATALAIKEASERRNEQARASTGIWVRFVLPWIVALAAFILAALNTITRIFGGS